MISTIRCSLLWIVACGLIGCLSPRDHGVQLATTTTSRPSDRICFTRAEVAKILKFKIKCRAKIKELRARNKYVVTRARAELNGLLKRCQIKLNGCYKQALVKHHCPSCVRPAVVAGLVAGLVGVGVGLAVGAVVVLAVEGKL
jgi:hypothetical protein